LVLNRHQSSREQHFTHLFIICKRLVHLPIRTSVEFWAEIVSEERRQWGGPWAWGLPPRNREFKALQSREQRRMLENEIFWVSSNCTLCSGVHAPYPGSLLLQKYCIHYRILGQLVGHSEGKGEGQCWLAKKERRSVHWEEGGEWEAHHAPGWLWLLTGGPMKSEGLVRSALERIPGDGIDALKRTIPISGEAEE